MSSRFVAVHDDGDLTFWILLMKNMYGSTKVTINTKDRKTMWIRIINWYELCVQVYESCFPRAFSNTTYGYD